jgi:uncharacterized protein YndB with AHSA1/START domain
VTSVFSKEEIHMEQPKVVHSTFTLERKFSKPPEVVFSAFSDPAKLRRWFADSKAHETEEFAVDFKVGGEEYLRYKMTGGPITGMSVVNKGYYHVIVPNERIVSASTMAVEGRPISASQVTIELIPTRDGTELICTHQGAFFENSDGPQIREQGWRVLMDKLTATLAN